MNAIPVKFVALGRQTSALLERFRTHPSQTEEDIISQLCEQSNVSERASADSSGEGCDLGSGVVLAEGEEMFFFRFAASRQRNAPEGVAIARGGRLYIDGEHVEPSRGSFVAPAQAIVMRKLGDRTSLDAWEYWWVRRNDRLVQVSELRPKHRIVRRPRKAG